ncbi:MAG: phosphatidylserine decarboxylase family protein [Bacteroidia bacterium]
MTIHREGHKMLLVLLIVLAIINISIFSLFPNNHLPHLLSLIASLIIFMLVLQFFRSPSRKQNIGDWVLCPADGEIVAIEEIEESEYYKSKRIQVSIFMSPLNVHINRFAISGKVTYFKYHEGLYLIASHPKSSTENERTTVVVEQGNKSVLLRQIAGYVARRIKTYCKVGEEATQGGEFGFIKFGSRVDILLPLDSEVFVKLGDMVKGGITKIASI